MKKIMLLMLAAWSANCFAIDGWTIFSETSGAYFYFKPGYNSSVFELVNNKTPNNGILSSVSHFTADCRRGILLQDGFRAYSEAWGRGNLIAQVEEIHQSSPIPGSPSGDMYEALCGK